jgi:C1A family cysteine protease
MRLHQKNYGSPEVERYRRSVFAANLIKIEAHNKDASKTYALGLTVFADLTQEEFASQYLSSFAIEAQPQPEPFVNNLTADVDWVSKGFTTPVKNQGQCGSCWAFSATGALEGLSKAKGNLQSFSEQQLVDCSTSYGNNGCNGGLMDNAFRYVEAKGITTESAYPYTAKDGSCKVDGGAFKNSKHVDITNCNGLTSAINNQVVSVAVDATNWSLYSSGVFGNCKTSLNHGVLLVGVKNGAWWIKNSWGTGWGEQGFIRLNAGNTCGLCSVASYPL